MIEVAAFKNSGTALMVSGETVEKVVEEIRGFQADKVRITINVTVADLANVRKVLADEMRPVLECLSYSAGYKPE